jgi:hypothetical protein
MTLPTTSQTIPGMNQTNTAGTSFILDMSAATGATALKMPVIAGATAGADGVIDYDSTNKMTHVRSSGVDSTIPAVVATVNQTSQTALISTSTLCAAASCNAGNNQYRVDFNFYGSGTACSSVTAGSVTFLLTWTDNNAVTHSAVALQMQAQTGAATTAMQASFPFQTALANESGEGSMVISTNGTIIQYATGYTACTTGTGTYNLRAAVARLQ